MVQALLVILVYVVFPLGILVWAYQRYKHGIKPHMGEYALVAFAIAMMLLLAFSSSWDTSDQDRRDVQQIVDRLIERYDFPVQAKYQDRPAVFGEAQPRRLVITIYGVIDRDEQDRILAVLRKLHREIASKAIVVQFMREEVWEELPDGSRQPRRDREELMRKARIE
ncbi:MAG TPA: hypothetical protein ENK51_01845 [Gammaproteobacteria bacterium]|nr:hypothetical protein [Gammaproteobacteria bacterium]